MNWVSTMTELDNNRLSEATKTATTLIEKLRELIKADNPLLSDIAIELLEKSLPIEQRLKRLEVITKD
jgi:hypothetical protein